MNVKLKTKPYEEVSDLIHKYMKEEPGIKEIFECKFSRLSASTYFSLIEVNEIPIGFLNLVPENLNGILYIDMGILEKYRGKGYGKEAIKYLLNIFRELDEYIIAETKETNELANGMSKELGELVHQYEGMNYYIFPKEKKEEFINSNLYNKFLNHCGNVPTKKKILIH